MALDPEELNKRRIAREQQRKQRRNHSDEKHDSDDLAILFHPILAPLTPALAPCKIRWNGRRGHPVPEAPVLPFCGADANAMPMF